MPWSLFKCWFNEGTEDRTPEHPSEHRALDAGEAAEAFCEENHDGSWDDAVVAVVDDAGVRRKFKVTVEYAPTFDAEELP